MSKSHVILLLFILYNEASSWRFYATSISTLIKTLKAFEVIKSENVEKAMLSIDRAHYAPYSDAYLDSPQYIGYGAFITAPHLDAFVLEMINEVVTGVKNPKVLDVGSGSGYLTACIAILIGQKGLVIGIDHVPQLVEIAKKNVQQDQPELLTSGRIKFLQGEGRNGHTLEAPYDVIYVGAASPIAPAALLKQLKKGGRLIIPLTPPGQQQVLTQFDQANGTIKQLSLIESDFMPLSDISPLIYNQQLLVMGTKTKSSASHCIPLASFLFLLYANCLSLFFK